MARPLRIQFPGAVYHVTSRGNGRQAIYLSSSDRRLFLETLNQTAERYRWRCYAWCLMDNHYHLVIETPEANLSSGMRQLNGVYTQLFNRRHGRVGHLFQGRFKAVLVDQDSYLLEVVRYTLLNPVRAGFVKAAGLWPWSSYRAMIGKTIAHDWLVRDPLLSLFSEHHLSAIKAFIRFVREGARQPTLWANLRAQLYLGDEQFVERTRNQIRINGDMAEIPRTQREPRPREIAYFRQTYSERDEGIVRAYATGAYTMNQIARCYNIHYSTVSRVLKRHPGKNA